MLIGCTAETHEMWKQVETVGLHPFLSEDVWLEAKKKQAGERSMICLGTSMVRVKQVIERVAPHHLITPYIFSTQQVSQYHKRYDELLYKVEKSVVILAGRREVISSIEAPYVIGISGSGGAAVFDPWYLSGHSAWIVGGLPIQQWRRFCECLVCGCVVNGIVLDGSQILFAANGGFVCGSTPYQEIFNNYNTVKYPFHESLSNLATFWGNLDNIGIGSRTGV